MKRTPIIGIMGGARARQEDLDNAFRLGGMIAENGWHLLNGGRDAGIMAASARGAAEKNGLTIGILPDSTTRLASPYIAIAIPTGLGNARNCINILASDVVVACPGGAGTLSEIGLALKNGKPVITMGFQLSDIPGIELDKALLFSAGTPEKVIAVIQKIFC